MSHVLKHWREAATLLLVAKTRSPAVTSFQTTNFEILMLKRSGKSKFMPKLHVFPGGVAHESDFSPDWMELFSKAGNDVVRNMQTFVERGGKGTHMFSRSRPEEFSKIPSELAFRICAIRETFEESGILLVRDLNRVKNEQITEKEQPVSGKSAVISDSILKPWREKVDDDAWQFISMCKELNLLPDIWSLYEWSNWLTPILPGQHGRSPARRYDTAFYLCVLDYIPNAVHCDKETTELEWTSSSGFLIKHKDENNPLQLAPPQIVELGRILHFTDAEKLKQFAWERSELRAQCWFPVTCYCTDGVLFIYPGDDLYPEIPDFTGEGPKFTVEGTIEELRKKYPNMNRSEMVIGEKGVDRTFKCNVKMSDGQVSPLFVNFTEENIPVSNL
ncbi:acyl-coenzyme A diphosphatase NUDT19-like [Mercenaria mercenaria]|uniref:acyl-coenzyme A diphosphatase NUDT19-like n=1 Tax=Mercenaria mercenaria TaxID=6596 RepID=UPI001E1D6CE3|nr:acyl-coenzyme A diphosphatase NUDT19-like [Mercenaria mercenaria]